MFSKVIVVCVVLAALGAVMGEEDSSTPVSQSESTGFDSYERGKAKSKPKAEFEITAAMVVDITPDLATRKWCNMVYAVGYDMALDAFAGGYGSGNNPSAGEVFDEALSRC